jgi:hypothetical protein
VLKFARVIPTPQILSAASSVLSSCSPMSVATTALLGTAIVPVANLACRRDRFHAKQLAREKGKSWTLWRRQEVAAAEKRAAGCHYLENKPPGQRVTFFARKARAAFQRRLKSIWSGAATPSGFWSGAAVATDRRLSRQEFDQWFDRRMRRKEIVFADWRQDALRLFRRPRDRLHRPLCLWSVWGSHLAHWDLAFGALSLLPQGRLALPSGQSSLGRRSLGRLAFTAIWTDGYSSVGCCSFPTSASLALLPSTKTCLVGEICGSPIRSNGRRKLGARSPRTRSGIARLQLFLFVASCLSN